VCPPDFYIIVTRAAERQGLDPLDWQCSNLGTALSVSRCVCVPASLCVYADPYVSDRL
jgi:hypothetical protein